MISGRYDYSIETARRIYSVIKDDLEAINVCLKCIENYYIAKGKVPTKSTRERNGMTFYDYQEESQSISLLVMANKPSQITLMQYDSDTDNLIEEAFYGKESFGLPVFMITVMEDMPQAMISLMDRETYVSLDTPQEQAFHQKMNILDDIIEKYGGNDW